MNYPPPQAAALQQMAKTSWNESDVRSSVTETFPTGYYSNSMLQR